MLDITTIDMTWFNYTAILVATVFGFTGLRIAQCKPFVENGDDFSWKILFFGTLKHLIIIATMTIVYVVGSLFGSDLAFVEINGTQMTIPAALNMVMLATVTFYSVKLIKTFSSYINPNYEKTTVKMIDQQEQVKEQQIIKLDAPIEYEEQLDEQTTFQTDSLVGAGDDVEGAQG